MNPILDPAALANRLDSFAAAYSFLARVLLAPADEGLLSSLADPTLLPEWPLPLDDDSRRGIVLLGDAVAEEEPEDGLMADYNRLFVGPGHLLAAPYESVYLSREGLLFDTPTMAVRAAYREFGLEAPALNREPDDHIGLEFSFLAFLCNHALDGLEQGDEAAVQRALAGQRTFLLEHLLRWGPDCLRLVETNAATRFYRGVAALGLGVLHQAQGYFVR